MTTVADGTIVSEFIACVKGGVARRLAPLALAAGGRDIATDLVGGKMLRTRFAARLAAHGLVYSAPPALERACVAVETLHTATLCHDDVMDNALIRRAAPTLWRVTGPSAAVMIGDWLLADSVQVVAGIESGRYLPLFLSKVQETCRAEAEHEISYRGRRFDVETGLRLARGKTGPFFSFIGHVCGGDDAELARALELAGYCVGTAYQLADDLLDVTGRDEEAGKTLGTDGARKKFTLAQMAPNGPALTKELVAAQCARALKRLSQWPRERAGLAAFLREDLFPLFMKLGIAAEAAA